MNIPLSFEDMYYAAYLFEGNKSKDYRQFKKLLFRETPKDVLVINDLRLLSGACPSRETEHTNCLVRTSAELTLP